MVMETYDSQICFYPALEPRWNKDVRQPIFSNRDEEKKIFFISISPLITNMHHLYWMISYA
jgi:hypothetical protein